jgi:murein DD-endopeptidase MepM/ murein hydrolase activator NlpD
MSFGAPRDGDGRPPRAHAACDLAAPEGTPVYAVADGTVIQGPYQFAPPTEAIEIDHGDFIARYGETLPGSALVKAGAKVTKGQLIAKVGRVFDSNDSAKKKMPMLHFEMYNGKAKGQLTDHNPKTSAKRKDNVMFHRRNDLVDPTPFLDAWQKNRPG